MMSFVVAITAEKWAACVLFAIPWLMCVYEIYRGLTKGIMREYARSSYREIESSAGRPDKYCHRNREPKTFWCLFAFYVLFTVLIPAGMYAALAREVTEPKVNPGNGSATELDDEGA